MFMDKEHTSSYPEIFSHLNKKIEELSDVINKYRRVIPDENSSMFKYKRTQKCSTICTPMKDMAKKLHCIKQCSEPIVEYENNEEYEKNFPIDINRLKSNKNLKETFDRYHRNPSSIEDNEKEAEIISDVFSMPMTILVMSDHSSWPNAMDVLKNPKHKRYLRNTIQNWKDRLKIPQDQKNNQLFQEAKEELSKKIKKHDTDQIIASEIKNLSDPTYSKFDTDDNDSNNDDDNDDNDDNDDDDNDNDNDNNMTEDDNDNNDDQQNDNESVLTV